MALFDTAMLAAAPLFMTVFGVTVTYQPNVLDRSISAIVRYPDNKPSDPVNRFRDSVVHLKVLNDGDDGISSAEFIPNQTISVLPRYGDSAVTKRLNRIIKQSAAFVVFEAL